MSSEADKDEKCKVGGQALIEGVMMRGAEKISWAVRKPGGEITVETYPFVSITKKHAVLGIPVIRGVVGLFESMKWGYRALSRSADLAMEEDRAEPETSVDMLPVNYARSVPDDGKNPQIDNNTDRADNNTGNGSRPASPEKSSVADKLLTALSFVLAFAISIGLFMLAPMWIASLIGLDREATPFLYNLAAGTVRITLFLIYLTAISMWSETRRLFEYHGAEHKAIHAYEDGKELTVGNIDPYTTVHPRCGTSFLVIVAACGILMSTVIDSLHFRYIGEYANIFHRFGVRYAFVPLLAGISYEALKLSAKYQKSKLVGLIIQPGLWVQRITTRKPDKSQIEVAAKALEAAL